MKSEQKVGKVTANLYIFRWIICLFKYEWKIFKILLKYTDSVKYESNLNKILVTEWKRSDLNSKIIQTCKKIYLSGVCYFCLLLFFFNNDTFPVFFFWINNLYQIPWFVKRREKNLYPFLSHRIPGNIPALGYGIEVVTLWMPLLFSCPWYSNPWKNKEKLLILLENSSR